MRQEVANASDLQQIKELRASLDSNLNLNLCGAAELQLKLLPVVKVEEV